MDFGNPPLRVRLENMTYPYAQPEPAPFASQAFNNWSASSPSSQSPSFLQTRCTVLEEQLRVYMSRLREEQASKAIALDDVVRLREERTQLEDDLHRVRDANVEFARENEALKDAIADKEQLLADEHNAHRHRSAEMEEEIILLKNQYNELVMEESILRGEKYSADEMHSEEIRRRRTSEKEVDRLERRVAELSDEVDEVTRKMEREQSRALRLQEQTRSLERDQTDKEPLVEIGIAVRTRFLQQARKMVTGQQTSIRAIKSGNAAAHRANGFVDAAVFRVAQMSGRDMQDMARVFKDLYQVPPLQYGYGYRPKKYLEAIDCEATIRTTISVRRELGSMPQRLQAMDQIDAISAKLRENGGRLTADQFDRDADVEWRLQRVKNLTDEIVEAARTIN
ncbi:hypothetical protein BP6252_02152 [Coleophoma cylindrospora]|uniref:Uncharacterized protein n=1 Tax=Coleophoma cylindrospora TaxID=1849047 RepID=A0A3D8SE25_9HELO|nr:hypothetical protein BP6252_02152 [Coleophoma cylindrospora]